MGALAAKEGAGKTSQARLILRFVLFTAYGIHRQVLTTKSQQNSLWAITVHEPRESLYPRLHNCRLVHPCLAPKIGVSQKDSILVVVSGLASVLRVRVE